LRLSALLSPSLPYLPQYLLRMDLCISCSLPTTPAALLADCSDMRYRAMAASTSAAGKEREREDGAELASESQDSRRVVVSVARKVRPAEVCQGGTCKGEKVSGRNAKEKEQNEPWQS
jgi:hypothetical protein